MAPLWRLTDWFLEKEISLASWSSQILISLVFKLLGCEAEVLEAAGSGVQAGGSRTSSWY